jgi:hypothetical protein
LDNLADWYGFDSREAQPMRVAAAFMVAGLLGGACRAELPRAVKPSFASVNYGLAFSAPAGASYCRISADWVGSDHGTVVFLQRPRQCGGTSYSSSGRGFRPAGTPRIEVYYGYWLGDDASPPPPCTCVTGVRLFGRERPICGGRDGKMIVRTVGARYMSGSDSEVSMRLVTTRARLKRDSATFRHMVESVRTCTAVLRIDRGKPVTLGRGPACPKDTFY